MNGLRLYAVLFSSFSFVLSGLLLSAYYGAILVFRCFTFETLPAIFTYSIHWFFSLFRFSCVCVRICTDGERGGRSKALGVSSPRVWFLLYLCGFLYFLRLSLFRFPCVHLLLVHICNIVWISLIVSFLCVIVILSGFPCLCSVHVRSLCDFLGIIRTKLSNCL